jgi:hypothetical protein
MKFRSIGLKLQGRSGATKVSSGATRTKDHYGNGLSAPQGDCVLCEQGDPAAESEHRLARKAARVVR